MERIDRPLTTTVVDSYPQPDGLIDRKMLGSRFPPHIRAVVEYAWWYDDGAMENITVPVTGPA